MSKPISRIKSDPNRPVTIGTLYSDGSRVERTRHVNGTWTTQTVSPENNKVKDQ